MTSPTLHEFASAGYNDARHFHRGWHELERDGRSGIWYRASGPASEIRLHPIPGCREINLLLTAPISLLGRTAKATLTCGATTTRLFLEDESWVVRRLPVPLSEESPANILLESCCVVPDEVLGNGDRRLLGLFLASVWQSK